MKILALLQPWASLIVTQNPNVHPERPIKEWETRSWKTEYRGQILVHASKGVKKEQRLLLNQWPFNEYKYPLELGKIIGAVTIVEVIKTEDWWRTRFNGETEFWHEQKNFGDFSDGRYAWRLTNPILFDNPIESKGQLGFWNRLDLKIEGTKIIQL